MAAQRHVIWITAAAVALASAACTLASPTYITAQEAEDTSEGGAKPSSTASPGAPSGGGGPVTCSTSDFVKPDLSTLTACGEGHGHCFAKDKISLAGQLVACADPTMVCVPDEILNANGQPLKSCNSIIGPGGCVTATLIPEIISKSGGALKPDVCDPSQLCIPCNDPSNNNAPTPFCQPIGAHSTACGASTPAPGGDGGTTGTPLPACCTKNGKSNGVCLAETAVPADQRDQTKKDSCADGNKCVPASLVSGKPVTCAALLGPGVCMDTCFNDMMKLGGTVGVLGRVTCGETEVCVPCGFSSTKIPGCP